MKKILILDIETTGFSHSKCSIVEVGIVSLDLDTGDKEILFDKVMHEDKTTKQELDASWIIKNTDMTTREILSSNTFDFYKEEIQSIVDGYELGSTAFNNAFDNGFLESRGVIFKRKLSCPMKLSTNICKIPGRYGNYKWPNVQEAYDFFKGENDYIEKHRGADDAYHEADIVYELYKRNIFKL